MASIKELKQRLDLHEVAHALGLTRKGNRGNYHSPHHADSTPSLEINTSPRSGDPYWRDYSSGDGGDLLDLVCYTQRCEVGEALVWLHDTFGIERDKQPAARPQSLPEIIAARALEDPAPAVAYLVRERGIAQEVAERAVKKRAVGWNTYTSPKRAPGEVGYGGPGLAFVVRDPAGRVVAVDMRYADPVLNGGVKTQTQGEKLGATWTSDPRRLAGAETVYFVESAINALSVECCDLYSSAAVAIRGGSTVVDALHLEWMRGKAAVLVMDNDEPDERGRCAGQEMAWALYERLTALNVATALVDQSDWSLNDVNDWLRTGGPGVADLSQALRRLEPWTIPGLAGSADAQRGRRRVFLPAHDYAQYWRYRQKGDFTTLVTERKDRETGETKIESQDVAGFRIAAITRVSIAEESSVMTGEPGGDRTVFAVAVQAPRHGSTLLRKVLDDDGLHDIERWKRCGPVFAPKAFLRLVSMLERTAHLGAREAANFVGLCWRQGKLRVNEGPDTYFVDPVQQCPYSTLVFAGGTPVEARRVVQVYQLTFGNSAALTLLCWALGGHLKAILGFWPHREMQAGKGAGKSTLVKRLERTLGMTVFSGQSTDTAFRLTTSVSHTSQPVGWEEISARRQATIDSAVALLQEAYQYTLTRRGSEMKPFLLCAPVLLADEDVPVKSLIGKLVRVSLREEAQGPLLPSDLPKFPPRPWLEFLAKQEVSEVLRLYRACLDAVRQACRAQLSDAGAKRMTKNYAAVATSWHLLAEFCGLEAESSALLTDLVAEMNSHIRETSGDRQPWVWILETFINELSTGRYRSPYEVGGSERGAYLAFLPSHVMHHFRTDPGLRATWDALPVKSDRVFKKQLKEAGVIIQDDILFTCGSRRQTHGVAVSLDRLATYGLHVVEHDLGRAAAAP